MQRPMRYRRPLWQPRRAPSMALAAWMQARARAFSLISAACGSGNGPYSYNAGPWNRLAYMENSR
eukprot:9929613-Lingulodinium_polyedra.AAC.1